MCIKVKCLTIFAEVHSTSPSKCYGVLGWDQFCWGHGLKNQRFSKKKEVKLDIPRGLELKSKILSWEGCGNFLEQHTIEAGIFFCRVMLFLT